MLVWLGHLRIRKNPTLIKPKVYDLSKALMIRILVGFLLVFFSQLLFGGDLKRVAKKYESGDLEKTKELIAKSLAKERINPGVRYFQALLFLDSNFPKQNLDSARITLEQSIADFSVASEKILEELADQQMGMETFDSLYLIVTKLHFDQSREVNTIESWYEFLNLFPDAIQRQEGINARDLLLFNTLLTDPSINNFQLFIENFPESVYQQKVKNKLDSMLVRKHQLSESDIGLETFIAENPQSEYVEEAVAHLLKLQTVSGRIEDFMRFAIKYQGFKSSQLALDLLFHIDKESGFTRFQEFASMHQNLDSLNQEMDRIGRFYFPIFDNGISLISPNQESIRTGLITLNQTMLCEGVTSDILAGTNEEGNLISTLTGFQISRSDLVKDLGYGFLLVEKNGIRNVIHKIGQIICEHVSDAEVIAGRMLKVKKNKWGLISFLGQELVRYDLDEVTTEDSFWIFENNGKFAIVSPHTLQKDFYKNLEFTFDDYELAGDDLMIGFMGEQESFLKSDGSFVVQWGNHQIFPNGKSGYVKDDLGYYYFSDSLSRYTYINSNADLGVQQLPDGSWVVESKIVDWRLTSTDSIGLLGNSAAWIPNEGKLLFGSGRTIQLSSDNFPRLLSNSLDHVLVKSGNLSTLYDKQGSLLISGNFDKISMFSDSLLLVTFRGKAGLYSTKGEKILPIRYDQLSLEDSIVSTLRANEIGALDLRNSEIIKTDYESKISTLGSNYKTKRKGYFGLIDVEENQVVPFEYDEILAWSDTLVWAKSGVSYHLLNLNDLVPERTVTLLSTFPMTGKSIKKFYGEKGFGLIDSEVGILLEPNFSDIRLTGSHENQIIVGEQSLPQAGYKVLTYFDGLGNRIHSQAYRPEEYEKVFCDD